MRTDYEIKQRIEHLKNEYLEESGKFFNDERLCCRLLVEIKSLNWVLTNEN